MATQGAARHADAGTVALDEVLLAVIDSQIAELARRAQLLRSIPGLGPATVPVLLAEIPELGALNAATAGALAGLASIARDSGKYAGKHFVSGGRKPVRDALYMATTAAARHNPDLKATFNKHREKGMPYKKAIIAIARKLTILANAVLKHGTPWKCPMH